MLLITVLDPGEGAFARGIASLGQALAFRSRRKEIRFGELSQDPKQLQGLAASFRAAKEQGQGDVFLESIGLDERFGPRLEAFVAGPEERERVAFEAAGGPEAVAEARVAEAKARAPVAEVTEEQAEAVLETGIIGLQAQNQVFEALSTRRELTADLISGLPELRSKARTGEALESIQRNAFGTSVFAKRREAGLDKIQVDLEVLQARAATAQTKFKAGFLATYVDYLNNLDPADPRQAEALQINLLGLENPAALNVFAQQSQIAAREQLRIAAAQAKLTGPEADRNRMTATITMLDEIEASVQEVLDTTGEARKAAIQNLNNKRLLAGRLDQSGAIFPLDLVGAEGRKGDLFFDLRPSGKVGNLLAAIQQEMVEGTAAERLAQFDALVSMAPIQDMTPRQKEEFDDNVLVARGILTAEARTERLGITAGTPGTGFPIFQPAEDVDLQTFISSINFRTAPTGS